MVHHPTPKAGTNPLYWPLGSGNRLRMAFTQQEGTTLLSSRWRRPWTHRMYCLYALCLNDLLISWGVWASRAKMSFLNLCWRWSVNGSSINRFISGLRLMHSSGLISQHTLSIAVFICMQLLQTHQPGTSLSGEGCGGGPISWFLLLVSISLTSRTTDGVMELISFNNSFASSAESWSISSVAFWLHSKWSCWRFSSSLSSSCLAWNTRLPLLVPRPLPWPRPLPLPLPLPTDVEGGESDSVVTCSWLSSSDSELLDFSTSVLCLFCCVWTFVLNENVTILSIYTLNSLLSLSYFHNCENAIFFEFWYDPLQK